MIGVGHQLIEPRSLSRALAEQGNFPINVAMMEWLIAELRRELGDRLDGVRVEVVCVEYTGAYPGLGIHYERDVPDVGPLVERTIDRLLQELPANRFVAFLSERKEDWNEVTARVMARGQAADRM